MTGGDTAGGAPGLRALLSYTRGQRGTLVTGGVLSLLGGAVSLAQPLLAAAVVDALQAGRSAWGPVLRLAGVLLGGAVVTACGYYLIDRAGQHLVFAVRGRLIGAFVRMRVPEADRLKPGDLVTRMTADTTLLRTVATASVSNAVTHGLLLVVGMALLAWMDPVLFSVTAAAVTVVALVFRVVLPRVRRASDASQEALGDLGDALERMFGALRTVKANSAEEDERARLGDANLRSRRAGLAEVAWQSSTTVLTWLPLNTSYLVVLGLGGARVATGEMGVGDLIAYILLLFYLLSPLQMLTGALTQMQSGLAALRRVEESLTVGQEEPDRRETAERGAGRTAPAPDTAPLTVEFDGVGFSYGPDSPPVHRGVSFRAEGPGLTAVVGVSGAGKTTLFSLVERFYDPDEGRVLVGGTDVRAWPLADLRRAIGYVEQDAPVLAGTLRENLTMAAPGASDALLAEVVRLAELSGLIARLPEGLDTRVGHRGTTLSGGERQRVAIARALLRAPRLLLLDEVTSQLDAANERALRQVIEAAAARTTVLVVAHRLSTVAAADRIVVMDAGRVRAVGTHEDLLRNDPGYRELAASQMLAADGEGSEVPVEVGEHREQKYSQ
ncbi:ABC transporter ATP-binding protein [Nocardiopsis sp. NPDC049922]|uniref:ABC transporter ATP-binding protein n=1 Tax=Nocardiopsis sp. NPDC049922 TaxID=3155157 RepID=UPI00340887FD